MILSATESTSNSTCLQFRDIAVLKHSEASGRYLTLSIKVRSERRKVGLSISKWAHMVDIREAWAPHRKASVQQLIAGFHLTVQHLCFWHGRLSSCPLEDLHYGGHCCVWAIVASIFVMNHHDRQGVITTATLFFNCHTQYLCIISRSQIPYSADCMPLKVQPIRGCLRTGNRPVPWAPKTASSRDRASSAKLLVFHHCSPESHQGWIVPPLPLENWGECPAVQRVGAILKI